MSHSFRYIQTSDPGSLGHFFSLINVSSGVSEWILMILSMKIIAGLGSAIYKAIRISKFQTVAMEIRKWGDTQAASDTFLSTHPGSLGHFEYTPRQPRTILSTHPGSLEQFWVHTQAASDNFEDTPRQPRIILSIFTTGFTTGFWHLGDIIAWWCRASLHIQCKLGQWQHRQGLHLYRNMTSKERKFECKHPWGGGYGGMVPTKLMKGWGTIIRMHTVIQITVWLSVVNCWIRDPTPRSVT